VARAIGGVLASGLGLSPLIRGLAGLFKKDEAAASPAPLVRHERPPAIHFEGVVMRGGGLTQPAGLRKAGEDGGLGTERWWATELIREGTAWQRPEMRLEAGADWTRPWEWQTGTGRVPAPIHVTVQVQAMDSRSFLEHSEDIARAVRTAVLHSHALNDVLNEL